MKNGNDAVRGGDDRVEGDRLYGAVDEHIADRGVHSDSADGRNCGPAVPRVCGDAVGGDHGFAGGFADDDADVEREVSGAARQRGSMAGSIAGARRALTWLTAEYERGLRWVLQPSEAGADHYDSDVCAECLSVHSGAEGVLPAAGHGTHRRADSRAAGCLVSNDEEEGAGSWRRSWGRIPALQNVMAFVGGGGPGGGGANSGNMFMSLKPDAERQKTGDTARGDREPAAAEDERIFRARQLYLQAYQELRIGGRNYGDAVSVLADGGQSEGAERVGAEADGRDGEAAARLKDVATDQQQQGLRGQLVIDRDTASRLGVSPLTIDATLSDAFGQTAGVDDVSCR